jgi:pantetheine-phosphate adenylyltransferase
MTVPLCATAGRRLHSPALLAHGALVRRAIYAGSFDPVTNGHLDVLARAAKVFDEIIFAVTHNVEKKGLFSHTERAELLREASAHVTNVRVVTFEGLLVDFARAQGAVALIRGLRAISDFEFEFQMALMNRRLAPELETFFLMPREDYSYVSSRIVKEVAMLGGDVSALVPACVGKALAQKLRK